ncbi:MAG: alpha/beta fold hydrolase [Thermoleophilia bacterium]|nr:alpha/beta fold hydrolase [Thermoleophilia bacterium]
MRFAPAVLDAGRLEQLGIDPSWSRHVRVALADGSEVEVHALVSEPPTGVPSPLTVVCVHGNPTWSMLWRSFHRRLGDRYRVVAIDQVSMGFSERTGRRRFAGRVDDLGRILDAFGVDGPVVLAAHDWGGPIALGWAVTHAERVRGMLLCNTGIAMPSTGLPLPIRVAGSRLLRDAGCRRTSAFVRATLATGQRRIPGFVRAGYLAPYRSSEDRRAIADFVADIPTTPAHPSAAALAGVVARLPGLNMPVLLAWGERDPVFHLEFAADLRRRLPQAELHRFPLAGHLVVEEEDVASVADAWIEKLCSPAKTTCAARRASALTPEPPWAALVRREDDRATAVAVGGGPSLSFSSLAGRVAGLASGLQTAGVAPGDRVALLTPDPPDFIAAAYACWAIGAVIVVVDRGLGLRGLARALRSAQPRFLLGTGKTLGAARALRWVPTTRRLDIDALRGDGEKLSAVVARCVVDSDAPAAVVFTSGATGPAKGVLYSGRQMAAQFAAVRECYAIGPEDRLVAAFAPFALYGPALGIPVAVPDCDLTEPASLRADALAGACASVGATIVFAAPAALEGVLSSLELLSPAHRESLDTLRLVLSAGAPVSQRMLQAFASLAPRAELHTPYGMTEVLSVADIDLTALAEVGPGRGVCVGRPLDGVGIRIEPLDGGDGETGEIVVSAPWLSIGYDGLWATNDHARSFDPDGTEWHRTGDVGHLDTDGRLWVEGRLVHVVWTVDGPVTSVPLEVAVESVVVARCAVTGIGPRGCQQIVVVVECDGKAGLAPPDLDRAVRGAGAPQMIAAVLSVPKLPVDRRHNSKIDRTRLGEWAEKVLAGGRAPGRV